MLNEGDFLGWCRRLALAETTQSAIAEVRYRNPTRRVGGGRAVDGGGIAVEVLGLDDDAERLCFFFFFLRFLCFTGGAG